MFPAVYINQNTSLFHFCQNTGQFQFHLIQVGHVLFLNFLFHRITECWQGNQCRQIFQSCIIENVVGDTQTGNCIFRRSRVQQIGSNFTICNEIVQGCSLLHHVAIMRLCTKGSLWNDTAQECNNQSFICGFIDGLFL